MERLDGKVAIVTGASSGIGRAIAKKFADEGAKVLNADVQEEPNEGGETTVNLINENGGEAVFRKTDVSDSDSVEEMVETAIDEFGRIDILVNNAGVYVQKRLHATSEEEWDGLMDVDLKGVYLCSKKVLNYMIENDIEGDIINISSIAGLVGFGASAAYCAAKGGVTELTREMALDYAPENINVNAINPGVIKTQMTDSMRNDPDMREFLNSNTPKSRLGMPEDIANAAVFLASDESDFVVGHNLVVDGGWTAH